MERIESVNPQRIEWCCADVGITIHELAERTGIAFAAFEKVLAGDAGLTFNQLRRVAAFFGRGVLFFLEQGEVNDAAIRTPQFRTLAQQKPELSRSLKSLIERVEAKREIFLSLKEDLDHPAAPSFDPPDLQQKSVTEAAAIARAWLDIKHANTFAAYREAVERKGILVFRTNGYQGAWQIAKESPIVGFALFDERCPVVVVKKLDFDAPQTFTLMHELGHVLLHKASSIDDDGDMYSRHGMERDANQFAGLLLVPPVHVAAIDNDRPAEVENFDAWLKPYRKAWGVSTETLLRRLLDVGRLDQVTYSAYREWRKDQHFVPKPGGNRAYRHREPMHIFGDPFVRTVFDALNARQITLTKATSYLDKLKIKDLHELEKYYAGA